MPTKYRVSPKLRGELSLSCFVYTLKPGQVISLTDEQSASHDIQMAINQGYLTANETPKPIEQNVAVEQTPVESKPAIVSKKQKTVVAKKDTKNKEPKTTMVSYDMEKGTILDQATSQKVALDRANIEKMTVQTGDINLEENETNSMKKAVEEMDKVSKSKKSIKSVGRQKAEKKVGDLAEEDSAGLLLDDGRYNEIEFVDEGQEKDRINSHPKLRNQNNNEIL